MSGFGNPATTTTAAFSFGTATHTGSISQGQPASAGFNFGTNTNTAQNAPSLPGFNFGTPTTTVASLQATIPPANTNQPTTGFNFGGIQQTQNQPTQNQPNQPTLGTVATPAFTGFAPPKTTAPAVTTNFSFGTVATATTSTGFSFGSAPALTSTTSASLNFGTTTTTATLGGALFGNTNALAPQQSAPGPNLVATSVAPAASAGLGGVDLNSTQPKSSEGKQDIKVKDIIIPQPIRETVENLKNFIKQQKSISSDIARSTIRKLQNVSGDIKTLEWSLQDISNCVEKNYGQIKNLRLDTSKAIQSVEMAQRTHETPVGLQFENTMPLQYFQELVHKYETDMIAFRNQVELTEKHMRSLTCPQSFSPEDLKRGLQQIHESFIALAGRLHEIHQKVEAQKEQYLNLRKYYLRDTTNVFSELETDNNDLGVSNISSGPTPFSGSTGIMWQSNRNNNTTSPSNNLSTFVSGTPQTTGAGLGLLGNNISTGFGVNNKPLFGTGTFGSAPAFNLQNPPAGAKRNKQ
ncbi:nuclear pore complex protein Nup58 isoform X2 [Condylostylus longicornis]|uniref:nuclear pore complex protein Nup58 isoform X2 n=1 Tax=Condylostylus longicornis TaxID=2530218 RepID=UPI00244E4BE7|nr:nuclear pore complex protein Nup58 isoform X2 [Condylostylus longicornis]